jgi:hydroxyacylglutathione hydrolase
MISLKLAGEKGGRAAFRAGRLPMMAFLVLLVTGICRGQADILTRMDEESFIQKYRSADKLFSEKCVKHLLEGNLAKAQKGLRMCQDIMPGHVNSLFYLSQGLYQKGDYNGALALIEQAEVNYKIVGRRILSIHHHNAEKFRTRKKEIRDVIDSFRGFERLEGACGTNSVIGQLSVEMQSIEGKEPSARMLESLEQVPAEFFYIHGNILFKLKRYAEARDRYLDAINTNPQHEKAYNNLAALYFMGKSYKAVLDVLDLAAKNGVNINTQLKDKAMLALIQKTGGNPTRGEREMPLPDGVARFTVSVGETPDIYEENTYIAFNPGTGEAVLIDPGARDEQMETFIQIRNLKINRILNTHGHSDHIGADNFYSKLYHAAVFAHSGDRAFFEEGKTEATFFSTEVPLEVGGLTVTVFHTPGHSPGSVCYLINGHLFSGDTLFKDGVGRTWGKTEAEEKAKMEEQVSHIKSKLMVLPASTRVFPGHGPDTTIGREKENNSLF